MKNFLLSFLLFFSIPIVAQDKLIATNGNISFEASVPFYEAVEAKNNQLFSLLNTKKGHITFIVIIKDFHFERSLMEDHFNANYMESKKYPKATFKGEIEKFSIKKLNSTPDEYYLKGKINIHGVTRNIRVLATISKTPTNAIAIQSGFSLNTDDFKIDIPFIVRSKISKNVNVKLDALLQ
ncbi:YceI family protein [Flavobacterium sufflavum]|uniref:YceI family protein n=1 Tax=Flavobacterium sufflavum TaxID=1921138 RepID=A0A437KM69_9FLAO|nr:YceI family protein [Flavobacterium sufflavum]RVT72271.1 YceI family protein [Flavobacterium sufflavum]